MNRIPDDDRGDEEHREEPREEQGGWPVEEPAPVARRYGKRMIAAAWIAAMALVFLFFDDHLKGLYNPNTAPLTETLEGGGARVVLTRNHFGHYVTSGRINGQPVEFMVDTGASDVNVPADVARKLNLKRGAPFQAHTANGVITVYRTHLDSVEVGGIRLHDLEGSINPHMRGRILLGMEFLRRLDFSQSGRELTLTKPPRR